MSLNVHKETWTAESVKQLIEDTVAEVRKRYPDNIVTDEVAGFIHGFTAGRYFPTDISDAVLVSLIAR
jgi:hypothetical protein